MDWSIQLVERRCRMGASRRIMWMQMALGMAYDRVGQGGEHCPRPAEQGPGHRQHPEGAVGEGGPALELASPVLRSRGSGGRRRTATRPPQAMRMGATIWRGAVNRQAENSPRSAAVATSCRRR